MRTCLLVAVLVTACSPSTAEPYPGIVIPHEIVPRSEMPGSVWIDGTEHALRSRMWVRVPTSGDARVLLQAFEILPDGRVYVQGVPESYSPLASASGSLESFAFTTDGFVITSLAGAADVELVVRDGRLTGAFEHSYGATWSVDGPIDVECDLSTAGSAPLPEWNAVGDGEGVEVSCVTGELRAGASP